MAELQKEAKHHLNKTTNTIILDYLLWLASKTILDEAATSSNESSSTLGHRSKGRRLVGLVDGLILTFDLTDRPKFSYALLTRRIDLASLVIVFVYRDSRSQYITRRSSESQSSSMARTLGKTRAAQFLDDRGIESVIENPTTRESLRALKVSPKTASRARKLLEVEETLGGDGGGRISLKDALHRFFLVSAAGYTTHTPGPLWISIALQFCLFAALETCLVLGEVGVGGIDECFSYAAMNRPEFEAVELNRLFTRSIDNADFCQRWEEARLKTLEQFTPPDLNGTKGMDAHLLRVVQENDFGAFRESVTTYLGAVLESMDDPELSKYPSSALDRSILRAPGMISIAHESTPATTTTAATTNGSSQGARKRVKVAS